MEDFSLTSLTSQLSANLPYFGSTRPTASGSPPITLSSADVEAFVSPLDASIRFLNVQEATR